MSPRTKKAIWIAVATAVFLALVCAVAFIKSARSSSDRNDSFSSIEQHAIS
jgi:hypothetical protein